MSDLGYLTYPDSQSSFDLFVGEDVDDADDPEEPVEWTAFGLMFVLGQLAFEDARPRELSEFDYRERDELSVSDFLEGLTFRGGALHFRADYIRGRRVKTDITVRSGGDERQDPP